MVYTVDVSDTGSVYSADSNVLLFRVTDGSAVATFASNAGVCIYMSVVCIQLVVLLL